MTLIKAVGLTVTVDGRTTLRDVDFSISPKEIITVIGPNGSGKTTLLRALIGAIPPTRGTISRVANLTIGYVPQNLRIDETLPITVERFLSLPTKRSPEDIADALARAGVAGVFRQQLAQLSGGQFQRVLLARALIEKPQLLVLDEPTTGLDQPGSAAFYRQIEQVRSELGCAILMVSHELHVVMSASDKVVCLNGHVCCHGTPEVVATAPEYRSLFGSGTQGALALYRHDHNHHHDEHTQNDVH